MPEAPKPLGDEVVQFSASVDDEVALGDLGIRKEFARNTMVLFAISNVCVLIGLGLSSGLTPASWQAVSSQRSSASLITGSSWHCLARPQFSWAQ